MSKKMRYFLLVLLLIIPFVVAACGGDDKDKDKDNGGSSPVAPALALTQSFTSATGLAFQYPEGWVAADAGGEAVVASSQAVFDKLTSGDAAAVAASGEAGMVLLITSSADLGLPENADNDMIFGFGSTITISNQGLEITGDAENVTLGGRPGEHVRVTNLENGAEGNAVIVLDGSNVIVGIMMTAAGGASDFEATALAIMDSLTYAAPGG